MIKMFLDHSHRHKLIDRYPFTKDRVPMARLKDANWDSHQPIRDDADRRTVVKNTHRFVEDGDNDQRHRQDYREGGSGP